MIHAIILAVVLGAAFFADSGTRPVPAAEPRRPYSCQRLDEEVKKCAFGPCDQRVIDYLRKECLHDGGRP